MVVRNSHGLDPVFHRMRPGGGKLLDVVEKTLIDVWIAGDWDWDNMESSVALLIQVGSRMRRSCPVQLQGACHSFDNRITDSLTH